MSNKERKTVEKIRNSYTEKSTTKIDELRELNKRVETPAEIFAYVFGTVGSLVLGTGMCFAMPDVLGSFMTLGIGIGLIGIAMVSLNYFIYKAILKSRRSKYKNEIIALSDEILNA